ncbi:hypothetical protein DdX_19510 [Ditylenchus destructor]|uniref:Uncharacterized protein n=1 Tax=Ditylenchus destructor TaxID=166010 RepID=A0AAD4MHM4_9BILA|nr:hypothetical protein DdX_19510 [Ditylenchus destructor]
MDSSPNQPQPSSSGRNVQKANEKRIAKMEKERETASARLANIAAAKQAKQTRRRQQGGTANLQAVVQGCISYPIYVARRRRRRASPVVGREAPDLPPWNVRELRTYTPEQQLLEGRRPEIVSCCSTPEQPNLTADGGGHTDTDEGILMAVREAMTNPISRCAR